MALDVVDLCEWVSVWDKVMCVNVLYLLKRPSTPLVRVPTAFSLALSMVGRSSSTVALMPAQCDDDDDDDNSTLSVHAPRDLKSWVAMW